LAASPAPLGADEQSAAGVGKQPYLFGGLPFIGAAAAAEPLIGPKATWWLSECLNLGGIKVGLPGIAAQMFFFSPVPVVKKMNDDGDTGKLPLLPYSAMATSGFLWTYYGMLLGESAIWAPNVPAFVMGSLFTAAFYKNCPSNADWLPGTKNMHLAGIAANIIGITAVAQSFPAAEAANIIGTYGCAVVVVMFSGPLVAIKEVIATKSTASLPFAMTLATIANCVLWTTYGWACLDNWQIWGPNALGLASGLVQLGLFAKYGFSKEE